MVVVAISFGSSATWRLERAFTDKFEVR